MLRVQGSISVKGCRLQIDDYVPLSFRCPSAMSGLPLYWRSGDFERSLIEVGLNRQSGAICKVTATLIDALTLIPTQNTIDWNDTVEGLPVCEIADWSADGYMDEPAPLITLIGTNYVSIWVAPETKLNAKFVAGDVQFGVDDQGFLRLLTFKVDSERDIERIIGTTRR